MKKALDLLESLDLIGESVGTVLETAVRAVSLGEGCLTHGSEMPADDDTGARRAVVHAGTVLRLLLNELEDRWAKSSTGGGNEPQ